MFVEVFTISHNAVDHDDPRGNGNFHEQEYAPDGTGSRKIGPKYFRRLDQALAYLQPTMFEGSGSRVGLPKLDEKGAPLVGTITKLQVEFPDDDFEPQPLSGKPVHKRGYAWVPDDKVIKANTPDGQRVLEVRKYAAESQQTGTPVNGVIQVKDSAEVFQAHKYALKRIDLPAKK